MIQELRLGNLVNIGNDVFDRVEEIYPDGISTTTKTNICEFEPIPLTPEILEKCGFEKINEGYFACYIGDYTSIELDTEVEFYNVFIKQSDTTDKSIKDNVLLGIEISYLHQLQNLYFSLTNNELQWD